MHSKVSIKDLEVDAENFDIATAKEIYEKHGCLVVRHLNKKYVDTVYKHVVSASKSAISLLAEAEKVPEGWVTPDGTLFIPASSQYEEKLGRDKQIMVLALDYYNSSVMLQVAVDSTCLDVVEAILGPNIELFGKGQCILKEPYGGNPKYMHQDNAYFEFGLEGPVGTLNYCIDTDLAINNGPLYVVPGTHRKGGPGCDRSGAYSGLTEKSSYIEHVDTPSHLGLNMTEWTFEDEYAIPVEGKAGDTIFFHINLVHGSPPNYSSAIRPTFINRYISIDDYPVMPLATSVEMRKKAVEEYKSVKLESTARQRGLLVRGQRIFSGQRWEIPISHH